MAGGLYVGLYTGSAKSGQTLLRNAWASIFQTVENVKNSLPIKITPSQMTEIDSFWTLVGYFNAKKELAGATGLYGDDVRQEVTRIAGIAGVTQRNMKQDNYQKIWGETDSSDLPGILDKISKQASNLAELGDQIDAMFCTSIFGTGIDIDRLAMMSIIGQPKTTSNYIQASGRVGRKAGGLVTVQLNSARPKDRNQYEFFNGYHRALHYFEEPITVYPFALRLSLIHI